MPDQTAVLFVCMGNICRSPTAEGVFRRLVADAGMTDRFTIDSAGTHAYHAGHPPDERSQRVALGKGIDLSGQSARRVQESDFLTFDFIVAMDRDNLANLESLRPEDARAHLSLLLEHVPNVKRREVPDPYYGGERGFARVFELIEQGSAALLESIRAGR